MRGDGREGAGLTTDLMLGGCLICGIWVFDGDGTAHDRDDHDCDGGVFIFIVSYYYFCFFSC